MMTSTIVDSSSTGTGNGIHDAVFSEGEEASVSGEEMEHHEEEGMVPGTITETPNCKRPFQDSQTEPDHSQAKKRRKQSKPVRLFSLTEPSSDDETEANNEGKVHNEGSPKSTHDGTETIEQNIRNVDPESGKDMESDAIKVLATESDHDSSSQCPYCPEILNPKERLKYHIENGHVQKQFQSHLHQKVGLDTLITSKTEIPLNLSHLSSTDSTSPIDFVVGSLMSELRNQTDDSIPGTKPSTLMQQTHDSGNSIPFVDSKMALPGYMPLTPHFLLPLMSQASGHNSSPSITQSQSQTPGTTPIRIFNPDAYCELCNKEFCNKYFLKTHKANKHGIYVDTPGSTLSGNTIQGPPYPNPLIQANLNLPSITSPVPGAQNPKPPPAVPKLPDTVIMNRLPGNGQMRAFCDICQKKFCNKYFVRRHKAKIHGIIDESLPTSGNVTFLNLPNCIRKQEIDERGSTSAGSDTGSNVVETVSSDIIGNVSEIEELRVNERHENNIQIKLSPTTSGTDDGAETSNVKEEPEQEVEEGRSVGDCVENNSVQSMKLSPTSSQLNLKEPGLSSDSLRKMGVINADAFCEICCKEYCNKYFLRTHKMKRHGIYISDNDGKDVKAGGSNSISWNHNQTSPLNLIVGEQGTNSSDSGEKVRNDFSDSDDPECDICGRRFQSYYLMQMHRAYLHMVGSERKEVQTDSNAFDVKDPEGHSTNCNEGNLPNTREETLAEAGNFNNNNDGNSNGGKDAISEDLQKLQTMILQLNNLNVSKVTTCTICNKESENNYCLRAHMMTEHGILLEDQNGVEGDKLPSIELSSIPPLIDTHTYCFSCKKDFFTQYQLKQHVDEYHNNYPVTSSATTSTPILSNTIKEEFEAKSPQEKSTNQSTAHAGSEKRISVTPTSSYCEICNKELCNKYFMKTHMQRMHGIEIENGAQIGGVICDICNKELCSKYFLRVHKQNTHGIVEDGSVPHSTRDSGNNGHGLQLQLESDQALKPSELSDLSHRYFSHFTEVCSICNRRFRSTKWLKAHLLNDHGENGVEKWKELENQYQILSQQGKQLQVVRNVSVSNHSSSGPGPTYSPTLKIPNNWHNQEQDNGCSRPPAIMNIDRSGEAGGHQVFSSLFGSGDSTVKNYHCSYCTFTTPVLAFLFVHERSHAGISSQSLPDPAKPFQCPVCLQSFLQADVFQHHILTHQFSGILNPFFGPSPSPHYPPQIGSMQERLKYTQHSPNNDESTDRGRNEEKLDCEVVEEDSMNIAGGRFKFRCSKCFQRFRSREMCLAHIQNRHNSSSNNVPETSSSTTETIAIKVTPHGMYKCMRCGFSSVHMVIVKKHIRKEHKAESTQPDMRQEPQALEALSESKEVPATDEVKKKLQEAARKSQVPASYAVPQSQAPSLDQFIMQPFLLEEPYGTPSSEKLQLDRKFVPSLVFLPVKEKLSEPLTVSFTLTPA
ncbi:uncharacterized protein [Periplaneta americana]|uniref:uncharacterized protein n=1 Tax=Periplaneta americana TaxID=6978 RepID=UPI0037E87D5F